MIEHALGLSSAALEAIAGLERRVLAADGGRLKLEWATLRSRPTEAVSDLLWWDGERLLGFVGIYGFGREQLELTGMVDPDARRRGIARALFEAALPLCRERGRRRLLLVVPRVSPGGDEFARAYDMSFEHSEHAMTLRSRPEPAPARDETCVRQAVADDIPALSALYRDGFGHARVDPDRLASERSRTLMLERDGQIVGTIAVARDGRRGAVYGFVVDTGQRGQGIGHEVLRRVCQDQFDTGAERVDLEVEVANDRALGLYTSVGFELAATDDYYELALG
ncbi:MAG: GNAT family N-acetyltransferase [Acidobacteriota bacterium]|nr:GNAT family N-acetyltransferase [Acidobacteriota bacterium]